MQGHYNALLGKGCLLARGRILPSEEIRASSCPFANFIFLDKQKGAEGHPFVLKLHNT